MSITGLEIKKAVGFFDVLTKKIWNEKLIIG